MNAISNPTTFIIFYPARTARAGLYVIGAGVHVCGRKKIESYISDRLTFSNIHGRTSR